LLGFTGPRLVASRVGVAAVRSATRQLQAPDMVSCSADHTRSSS
jgi:hypothetical protein